MTTSPPARWLHAPTARPSTQTVGPALPLRSNNGARCGPRYQPRSRQPMIVGSRAGSRLTVDPGSGVSSRSSGRTHAAAVDPSSSTSTVTSTALVGAQGGANVGLGPFRPPGQVLERARAEGPQPSRNELGPGGGRVERRKLADPIDHACPAVLAGDPRAERTGAGDQALRGHQEQQACRHADRPLVPFADGDLELQCEVRDELRQLVRRQGSVLGQRLHRLGLEAGDPGVDVLGDAGVVEHRQQLAPLPRHEGVRARGLQDRRQIERHDEHRAAHGQHPQQGAALVQRVLEVGDGERIEASTRRQHDRRWVTGVQADEVSSDLLHRRCRGGEVMTHEESPAAFGDVEVAHRRPRSRELPSDRMSADAGGSVAEIVLPADRLDDAIDFLVRLGLRLDSIEPADAPSVAVLSGHGLRVRLDGSTPSIAAASAVPTLEVTRADDAGHIGRAGMRYRDVLPSRYGGRLIASHISIADGGPVADYVHHHDVRFQVIYCLRGWVRVVYEDQGPPFVLEAGDCVLQPPGIRHRVFESSAGLEVVGGHEPCSPHDHRRARAHVAHTGAAPGSAVRRSALRSPSRLRRRVGFVVARPREDPRRGRRRGDRWRRGRADRPAVGLRWCRPRQPRWRARPVVRGPWRGDAAGRLAGPTSA